MSLPQMADVLTEWIQSITCQKLTNQTVNDDGWAVDNFYTFVKEGVIQPLSATQLQMKPEGERAWAWLMVHIPENIQSLNNGDFIFHNGEKYRIKDILPYRQYGYTEYHAVKFKNNSYE